MIFSCVPGFHVLSRYARSIHGAISLLPVLTTFAGSTCYARSFVFYVLTFLFSLTLPSIFVCRCSGTPTFTLSTVCSRSFVRSFLVCVGAFLFVAGECTFRFPLFLHLQISSPGLLFSRSRSNASHL